MLRTSQVAVTLVLLVSIAAVAPSSQLAADDGSASSVKESGQAVTLMPASATSPDIPFSDYDPQSERVLLDLANQARRQIGAPPLTLDSGMSRAARAHAEAMLAARQLSHQLAGEPSLPQRLAAETHAQLDQEGENVALDFDAEKGHQHLMLSPPHRANLLNPAYNVVGLGVVRSGDRLYIVQDFGHALPNYSIDEVKELIAAAVERARREANRSGLARRDLPSADDAACSMAQADKLGTLAVHQLAQRYTVISYTNLYPDALPENAGPTLHSPNLWNFSVGACYARTETYPTGAYWVVLSLE